VSYAPARNALEGARAGFGTIRQEVSRMGC